MPELPEVETIRRQIAPVVQYQQVTYARVTRARAVRSHRYPDDFIALIVGHDFLDVRRRGKALLLPMNHDRSLLVRLGMSGKLMVTDPDAPLTPHTHVVLGLSNDMEFRYIDPRTFGQMAIVDGHDPDLMPELGHYGVEPLDDAFSADLLCGILQGKHALIQAVLMDQSKIAGIGKIYADEACFLAGIHPQRTADTITAEEAGRLHHAIREVLTRSIASRGTSTLDAAYRDADGKLGGFQHQLHVYQRDRLPCRICGTLIEYRPFQGRRMHFCPHCQH